MINNQDPKPFDHVHLQWFADGDPAPELGPEPEPKVEPKVEPPKEPPTKKFLQYAPDKYKKDPKYAEDLSKHDSWGDILDRMYTAEGKLEGIPKPPESVEGYEFTEVEFPEELQSDDYKSYREAITAYFGEVDKAIREMAHKNGWSKESAQEAQALFVKQVFEQEKAAREAFEKAKIDGLEVLKKDWKGDFEPNTEISRRAIETFGKDALVALFDELEVSNHPAVIKTFYEIGKGMGEGTLVPGHGGPAELGPEDAKKQELEERYKDSPELIEMDRQKVESEATTREPSDELKKRYGVTQ